MKTSRKVVLTIFISILTLFTVFALILIINRFSNNFLPKSYQQASIGNSYLKFENGKLVSSEIYAELDGVGKKLIYANKKLNIQDSHREDTLELDGTTLINFADALTKDFKSAAGYDAYKADIISEKHFIDALAVGTEIIWFYIDTNTFESGTYDGMECLGAATVIDNQLSTTKTILFR